MDFVQAEQQRQHLNTQLAQGQITPAAYTAAINAIRVTDSAGRWWQPAPQATGWLYWDGKSWLPGTPPAGGKAPGQELMSMDEFKKISKETPLVQRPQRWWDLLSILGGIAAAIIWFLYGGLREGFDVISAFLMVAIPVGLVFLRAISITSSFPSSPAGNNFQNFS
jgi:hypothetical protein